MGNIACHYKLHMILNCYIVLLVFVCVIVLFAAIFMSLFHLEFV